MTVWATQTKGVCEDVSQVGLKKKKGGGGVGKGEQMRREERSEELRVGERRKYRWCPLYHKTKNDQ